MLTSRLGAWFYGDAFTARYGINSYTGTRETTIYASPAYGLISFDVTGVATDLLQSGETCASHLEVVRATLDVTAQLGGPGTYTSVEMMNVTAPAWTEVNATDGVLNSGIARHI